MRKYIATIYYNATIHTEKIVAKNLQQANEIAFKIAYKLTGYGMTGFLEHVSVRKDVSK